MFGSLAGHSVVSQPIKESADLLRRSVAPSAVGIVGEIAEAIPVRVTQGRMIGIYGSATCHPQASQGGPESLKLTIALVWLNAQQVSSIVRE